jgi:hypothetical protein
MFEISHQWTNGESTMPDRPNVAMLAAVPRVETAKNLLEAMWGGCPEAARFPQETGHPPLDPVSMTTVDVQLSCSPNRIVQAVRWRALRLWLEKGIAGLKVGEEVA